MNITEFPVAPPLQYRDIPVGSLFSWKDGVRSIVDGRYHVGYKAKNGFCFFSDHEPEFHIPDSFEATCEVILLDHELIIKGEL